MGLVNETKLEIASNGRSENISLQAAFSFGRFFLFTVFNCSFEHPRKRSHPLNRTPCIPRRSMLRLTSGVIATSLVSIPLSAQESEIDRPDSQRPDPEGTTERNSESDAGQDAEQEPRLHYTNPRMSRWKFGMVLKTPVTCANVFGTFVVPIAWPEQKITPVNQTIDGNVTGWEGRDLYSLAKQVAFQMRRVTAGSNVEISFEYEIERSRILVSDQTRDLLAPAKIKGGLRRFMGNSPNIDTSNGRVKKVSRELANRDFENAWDHVEQIYDFVRSEVNYVEGPIRKASDALKLGKGDCEDMTSLFVAICRNNRIPARMVWIPDHCYPEFYLEDKLGEGHWFPCQAAGTRQFGRMDEYRPILQKGDKFKVAEHRTPVRYVAEFFKCDRKGKRNPHPTFIRQQMDS